MAGRCPEEVEEEFIADCRVLPVTDLCDKYGKARSTIMEWRTSLYRDRKLFWYPGIRVGGCPAYDEYMEIEGDVMVISDLEIPYHDIVTLGYAVAIAQKFGVKKLLIGGDLLANDAIGYHAMRSDGTDASTSFSLADSLDAGKGVLQDLFEHFDWIGLIKGNHEQRGTRIRELGFFEMMQNAWEDIGDLEISYYKWCRAGQYRIEHPTYRKVPGSIARERAEIEDCSVLCAHTHGFSLSFTKNGKYQAVDLGHCTLPETRYYKTVDGTGPHPQWVAGFWMIRNGFLYGFPTEFTDWGFWLKEMRLDGGKKKGR